MRHLQASGHYDFRLDVGLGVNYRVPERFPVFAGRIPDGSVPLNVCNFNCAFFADQHGSRTGRNRSDS